MIIRHKGLEHTVYGEAPFLGARLCAIGCSRGCRGCHNEHLKNNVEIIEETVESVVGRVKRNPFNQGLILGGLEWTEQPEEMLELIRVAKDHGLEVMLYTHMGEEEFVDRFGRPSGIYVKHGEFVAGGEPHRQYGVQLANREQYIIWYE